MKVRYCDNSSGQVIVVCKFKILDHLDVCMNKLSFKCPRNKLNLLHNTYCDGEIVLGWIDYIKYKGMIYE